MMAKPSAKAHCTFTDVHKTGPDRLHLPISRVFGHLKRREPSQVYTKPVPIAAIFRFRDIVWIHGRTNIDFWSPLHNSPFGAKIERNREAVSFFYPTILFFFNDFSNDFLKPKIFVFLPRRGYCVEGSKNRCS